MDKKISFIYSAINDAQSTIRSLDAKIFATLASSLIPASSIGKIVNHFSIIENIYGKGLMFIISGLFFLSWILTTASLVKALAAIDNPSKHIPNNSNYKGTYYCGGIYRFKLLDVFLNRDSVICDKGLDFISSSYPYSDEDIIKELAFEHIKIAYIRDIKIHRFKYAIIFGSIWFTIGVISYFMSI